MADLPDFSNEATRLTKEQLGNFEWDIDEYHYGDDLVTRGPFELDNGAVYKGSWSKEGLRHGCGLLLW